MMALHAMDGLIVEFRWIENAYAYAIETDLCWNEIRVARQAFFSAVVRLALVDLDDTNPGNSWRVADVIRAGWYWHKRAAGLGHQSADWQRGEVMDGMNMLLKALRRARWLTDKEFASYVRLLSVFCNSAHMEALITEREADRAAGRFPSRRDIEHAARDMFYKDLRYGRPVRSALRAVAYWFARADGGDMTVSAREYRVKLLGRVLEYAYTLQCIDRPVYLRYTRLLSVLSAYGEVDHFYLAW